MEILSLPYLKKRLQSSHKRVQMWAAYHLAERWHEQANEFVGALIESDIPEIKESGVYLVGHQQLHDFAFPIFRIFNSEEGILKRAAVRALTAIQYPALARSLWSWLEELFLTTDVNYQTLQDATQSFLLFDPEKNWWAINEKVSHHYHHHIKSLALFGALSEFVQTPDQLSQITHHYSHYRNNFTDPQFLNYFLKVFDNQEIIEFIRLRANHGYSMRLIYQECLNILGWNLSAEFLKVLEKIDTHCIKQSMAALPDLLIATMRLMFPHKEKFFEEYFLEHFKSVLLHWKDTIVKIQDQEFFFILSLPLIRFVKEAEKSCLALPEKNATRIARIYHSPLMRLPFMTSIINLFAEKSWAKTTTPSYHSNFTTDTPREALWRLVTHQTPILDYPFCSTLPTPWEYDIPFLLPRLLEIYKQKLEHCITTGQCEEINYALELFMRQPDEEIVDLMLIHFTQLINQHFHLFFEFIEYFPDQRFITKLIQHHRDGEKEIQQLIELLCEIHQQPHTFPPQSLASESLDIMHVRILCPECHTSYRYPITVLYFDQETLEQRHVFTNKDIWTTDKLACKNCYATLPFEIEERFLANLYTELLAAHLLKVNEEEQKALAIYKPLMFPQYFGKKINPGIFLKKAIADLNANRFSASEQSQLLLEIGKLYLAIEQLGEAQEAFQKSLDLAGNQSLALFNLGIIAFRQKNIYEARLHFSRFIRLYSAADFEAEAKNLFQLALHYLEVLNHREFKRSTFKLLS